MICFLTAGESHGPSEVAILEGIPSGLNLTKEDIQKDLDKRKSGAGRGGRGIIEDDQVEILSGVRHGKTLGSPIALKVDNLDFKNWSEKMSIKSPTNNYQPSPITNPRPGHADLPGMLKYHFTDIRNVLERASARETVMRVAVGSVCRKLLSEFGIEIASHTIQIGQIRLEENSRDFEKIKKVFETDPEIRCIDPKTSGKMKEEIKKTILNKNTLGGVIEIIVKGIPTGLGSYVHWDRKLDGQLSASLMSIPSANTVGIGNGIENASKLGSEVQDEIELVNNKYARITNRAGGIEGGVTNGEDIILRVYHKPISTLGNPLKTVDITTKKEVRANIERSDICVVPRAGVISESMAAFTLAQAFLEKFGGDSLTELRRNYEGYLNQIATDR